MTTRAELDQMRRDMAEALANPEADTFIAVMGGWLIIGGTHAGDYDWCWCQETMDLHGCGHRHGAHREVMD